MFSLSVHVKVKKNSDISKFEYHLGEMAKKCPLEVGCIYYKVNRITEKVDDERKNVMGEFLIVESWESEVAWKNHLQLETYLEHYKNSLVDLLERDVYFLEDMNAQELKDD